MYLIFATLKAAQIAVELIDSRGRLTFLKIGYEIDNDGEIKAAHRKSGTQTWAVPAETTDGRWAILSPVVKYPHLYDRLVDGLEFEVADSVEFKPPE